MASLSRFITTNLSKSAVNVSRNFSPGNNFFSTSSISNPCFFPNHRGYSNENVISSPRTITNSDFIRFHCFYFNSCSSSSESVENSQYPKPNSRFRYSFSGSDLHFRPSTISEAKSNNLDLNFVRFDSIDASCIKLQTPFGQKPRSPVAKFVRFYSHSAAGFISQTPLEENPKNSNLNFCRFCSNFATNFKFQTPSKQKPKNSDANFYRFYSHSASGFKSQSPLEEKLKNPNLYFIRSYSDSATDSKPQAPSGEKPTNLNFRHQEIEGPTVDRDLSALANETREELQKMVKLVSQLSKTAAVLGVAHLALGAVFYWFARDSPINEAMIQSIAAFGFPFTVAFVLRQSVKPVIFFNKMEEQGRLQILTLTLQAVKCLNQLFTRVHVISIFCATGVSIALLSVVWLR